MGPETSMEFPIIFQWDTVGIKYLTVSFGFLQMMVYNDLGKGVLKNAWEGFNTSLFAYGQTGSGKSWSIVGYGANKGVQISN